MGNHEFVLGARNLVEMFKQMVLTRRPPIAYSKMIELIAVVEAARRAQKTGRPVHLKDLPDWNVPGDYADQVGARPLPEPGF